ncbi:hypothetical protein T09_7961 [Trichinella sp. T9]|nr:hypothetical protein T09_7961 [Trichinella sp. T9]
MAILNNGIISSYIGLDEEKLSTNAALIDYFGTMFAFSIRFSLLLSNCSVAQIEFHNLYNF